MEKVAVDFIMRPFSLFVTIGAPLSTIVAVLIYVNTTGLTISMALTIVTQGMIVGVTLHGALREIAALYRLYAGKPVRIYYPLDQVLKET